MDTDSEVDLYSSQDEEDVLINFSSSPGMKQNDMFADVKTCPIPLIDSPDSLSKKVLSCISPIDNVISNHRFEKNSLGSSIMKPRRSNSKGLKNGKTHQICRANKKNLNSSSIIDTLQLLPG
jgi:hypothetical protein